MPIKKKSRKRRRKVRYSTVKLKLTASQRDSLDIYCRARNTTQNKLIKKLLRKYFGYKKEIPEGSLATPNQLGLFDEPEDKLDEMKAPATKLF
jgi:hypothetical protein